jgi:hypothetical protein
MGGNRVSRALKRVDDCDASVSASTAAGSGYCVDILIHIHPHTND